MFPPHCYAPGESVTQNDIQTASSPKPLKTNVAIATFLIALPLLFVRLGHYALWDDEAGTALTAIGVWRTGDTSAVIDHNVVAYESGKDLVNLRERLMPPLPAYLAAPFVGLFGRNAIAARLPFVLCGAACVGLMVWWAVRSKLGSAGLLFFAAALLTNVSFFLFCRQCRYYAVAMLTSVALAWLYVHYDGRRWKIVLFSFISLCLFASNYLNWAAFYMCLAIDYLIWGRKNPVAADLASRKRVLRFSDWLIILLPQLIIGGIIFSIWNPLRVLNAVEPYPVANRLLYLWWTVRDITTCEFGAPLLVLLAVALSFTRAKAYPWLLRSSVCLIVYIIAMSFLVQRPPSLRGVAAVRYLIPIIPLFVGIAVMSLNALHARWKWAAMILAAVAFSSNLLNGGPLLTTGLRSTIVDYVIEIVHPPTDPYTATVGWIRQNVHERESVWVVPDYATYPLMFHAPAPTYAWQLTWPPAKPEFTNLPAIHFIGRVPPQYIVGFGPATKLAADSIVSWNRPDLHYSQIGTIDCFWKDMHRPELFWRTFRPVTNYDKTSEAIYLFRLDAPSAGPARR